MLSAVAVISFVNNWVYVVFAALGAWIGAYATMKYLRWRSAHTAVEPASDLVVACTRRRATWVAAAAISAGKA